MPCARTCRGNDRFWKSLMNGSAVTHNACKSCFGQWSSDELFECHSETDSPPSAAMGALWSGNPSLSPGWRWRSGIDSARRPRQRCACTRILFPSAPRWLSPTWQRWAEHNLRKLSSTISLMLDHWPLCHQRVEPDYYWDEVDTEGPCVLRSAAFLCVRHQ